MKVVGLVSGGKDSCYNMMKCVEDGCQLICLANLCPPKEKDEIDSFMYQSVAHQTVELYGEAIGVPLLRQEISGTAVNQDLQYSVTKNDEVEDLYVLLSRVKREFPDVEGVSVGAILSEYQKNRVENICSRIGLKVICKLWKREESSLLEEMIKNGINAVLVKVAAIGLTREHIGKNLKEVRDHLLMLNSKYGVSVCGEGGEYESFVVDCPLFKKRICIDEYSVVSESENYCRFGEVAYMHPTKFHLEDK
uniref:Diphthine--ammonia ligase n=1 Tax=Syphacia muris TaxID=451379 RepID=A0A0N5ALC6_9BILA